LTTISYIDSQKLTRNRLSIVFTGALLLVAHFVGLIALYAQGAATFLAAKKRRLQTVLGVTVGIPFLIFGMPVLLPIRRQLFYLYQVYGNSWNADVSATRLSLLGGVKIAFAGYVLVFGYHVYPFRLLLVIPGVILFGFLLVRGVLQLRKKQSKWMTLPFTYAVALAGIYVVLDSVGGRVASGVAPRHAAFVWPAFIVLLSLGLSSFNKTIFQVLLVAVLAINSFSLWFGWQKHWTYGVATDYRTAGAYVSSWADKDSAMIIDGRASEALDRYFPKALPVVTSRPGSAEFDQLSHHRLILVTNDWRPQERQQSNELISLLSREFEVADGRVDYPLFEYVLDRKPSVGTSYALSEHGQLRLPPSIYGVEFQDLTLPVTVNVSDVPFKVTGAFSLPSSDGSSEIVLPLSHPLFARRLILLTNVVGLNQSGAQFGEVLVQDGFGGVNKFPLRMDRETASWAKQCPPTTECKTVFQWHKRITMVGQNRFPDAWRDFQAGMHAVVFDLLPGTEINKVTVRYRGTGHLYIWGIALRS